MTLSFVGVTQLQPLVANFYFRTIRLLNIWTPMAWRHPN